MVDAFVQGGKVKPVLPEGRREDIVSTLAWLIANTWQGDDEVLDAYIAALEAEQEKQGVREPLLAQSGLEIPDEQIADREGWLRWPVRRRACLLRLLVGGTPRD